MMLVAVIQFTACNSMQEPATTAAATEPLPEPKPPKTPCPVKLIHPRMEHNLEMDVYATVMNVSKSDITAIGFSASHTKKFGDVLHPYRTDLTSEDTIKHGQSQYMHWE
jgi:hypothetical protein